MSDASDSTSAPTVTLPWVSSRVNRNVVLPPSTRCELPKSAPGSSRPAPRSTCWIPSGESRPDHSAGTVVTVAQGRTNAEIAGELHISLSTVKFHLASLMNKIGARNRVEIAIWAYETKRVRP